MLINNNKWKNIILLVGGFTIVVILFEILPRLADTSSMFIDWIEQHNKIEQTGSIDLQIKDLTVKNNYLKKEITYYVSNYEENQQLSSILSLIDEISSKTNIIVESIKPGKIEKKNNLWLQPMNINLSGKYEDFYNFIKFLESSQKVVIIKSIQIKPENQAAGVLSINTNIEVYLNI